MLGKGTDRLKTYTFKLNSLLAITQAINENLSKEDLLKRYEKILKEDLGIGKILIFMNDGKWYCILQSGFADSYKSKINFETDLLIFKEISFITSAQHPSLENIDIVIPVYNNNTPLAYVLIGDIDEESEGVSPTIKHLHFIQTLSNIIIVAIENIRLFQDSLRQEALKKELELASKMQNMLIPNNEALPKNEKIWVTSFYHPHLDVGGDYYDVIPLSDNEIGFCIADVSGKGISAAILMSNFQANLRALFSHEISLDALIEKLNERVLRNAKGEKFITIFIAKYNYKTKELNYINAAHNPPIMYEVNSKKLSLLKLGCVGMGMLDEIPFIKKGSIFIKEKTKLLCYTDGLVEMLDESGIEIATTALEQQVSNENTIHDNIAKIIETQHIMTGNKAIFDDITMLGVEFY